VLLGFQIGIFMKDPVFSNSAVSKAFFSPNSVAVIGATDKPSSVGKTLISNLRDFPGNLYAVNPRRSEVLGVPCYASVTDIDDVVDLAIIAIPARVVPQAMRACAEKGIRAVIVVSAGFKEAGPEGLALESEILAIAREAGIRIIGPNCLGLIAPHSGLNASFAMSSAYEGSVAFISQSGAICTATLDWSLRKKIGFSAFVSIGSMADVEWADLIEYFGEDPKTKAILMYVETLGESDRFIEAAKKVACRKPIIVIKPGKSKEAAAAALSHTGALVGSDKIFDAVCDKTGILRVSSLMELFDMAEVLERQPYPKGPNLAIVTNAGGPGILATDAVIDCGASMATLSDCTVGRLNELLPGAWSHGNPIDILGDAPPDRYAQAVGEVLRDERVDGLLVILTPQEMTDPTATAEKIASYAHIFPKPILTCWMGGDSVYEGRRALESAGVPSFAIPRDAVWSFSTLFRHAKTIRALRAGRVRRVLSDEQKKDVHQFLGQFERGRVLSEFDSKHVFRLLGFPVVETFLATTVEEAVVASKSIGYPVVLKVHSSTVTHKAKAGGVFLNLFDEESVREAFASIEKAVGKQAFAGVTVQKMVYRSAVECIIGSSIDRQFGPVILFGAGGSYVESIDDTALSLPPVLFPRMLCEKTQVFTIVEKVFGSALVENLETLLRRFSEVVEEFVEIEQCDINPLLVSFEGLLCLDARIILKSS